jgi:hypothetical protein
MKNDKRSKMNTSLKVILTAVGIAVLASPVMAQPESSARQVSISNAHGSAFHVRAHRAAATNEGNQIHVEDCAHSGFPQCSNGQ